MNTRLEARWQDLLSDDLYPRFLGLLRELCERRETYIDLEGERMAVSELMEAVGILERYEDESFHVNLDFASTLLARLESLEQRYRETVFEYLESAHKAPAAPWTWGPWTCKFCQCSPDRG